MISLVSSAGYFLSIFLLLFSALGLVNPNVGSDLSDRRFYLLFLVALFLIALRAYHSVITGLVDKRMSVILAIAFLPLSLNYAMGAGNIYSLTASIGIIIAASFIVQNGGGKVYQLMLCVLSIGLTASILTAILFPDIGQMPLFDGAWRGLLAHKNRLGGMASISVLLGLGLVGKIRFLPEFTIAAGLICLVFSESTTSLIVLIMSIIFVEILKRFKRGLWRVVLSLFTFCVGTLIAIESKDIIERSASIFGKDATFTGRVPLWNAILESGALKPLGYGFDAFWRPDNTYAAYVSASIGWFPYYSHNGYLEIWIIYGGIVAFIFISTLIIVIRSSILDEDFSKASLLIFYAMYNTSEAIFTQYDNPMMMIFVILILTRPPKNFVSKAKEGVVRREDINFS